MVAWSNKVQHLQRYLEIQTDIYRGKKDFIFLNYVKVCENPPNLFDMSDKCRDVSTNGHVS